MRISEWLAIYLLDLGPSEHILAHTILRGAATGIVKYNPSSRQCNIYIY